MFSFQFSNKRTGSTFLQKSISSHPKLIGIDECFVNISKKASYRKSGFIPYVRPENTYKTPETYIKNIINTYPNKKISMKLMYNQIGYHHNLHKFIRDNKLPIIHLMRRNLVKQIISGQNAATTKHDPITITPQQLLHSVKLADKLNEKWKEMFKNHASLELYYEDIIGEKDNRFTFVSKSVNMDICNFFSVKNIPMYTDTKKKNKNDIWVYLQNREEVEKVFKGTQYQWMIED